MKQKIKVSVIMGVYNPQQERLLEAVQSIIKQSLPDWELILYDDGSKKEAAKTICAIAKLDDRIHLIRSAVNRGLAHALNVCIQHTSGDYLARMDDDDIADPARLEKQFLFSKAHPEYQWVGSNALLADENGIWGIQKMPLFPRKKDFLYNSPFIHPTVMFHKEVLRQCGGYSTAPENLHGEDYELFMRLYGMGFRGCNIQEPLLTYWEDRTSYQNRTYRRRIREMKLRYRGFKQMQILNPATAGYVLKPLFVGVIPPSIQRAVKKRRWRIK